MSLGGEDHHNVVVCVEPLPPFLTKFPELSPSFHLVLGFAWSVDFIGGKVLSQYPFPVYFPSYKEILAVFEGTIIDENFV